MVQDVETGDIKPYCATPDQMTILCGPQEQYWVYYDDGDPNHVNAVTPK